LVSEVVGDDPGNLPTFKFDISGAPHCAWVRDLVADGDVEANPGPTTSVLIERFLWEAAQHDFCAAWPKLMVAMKVRSTHSWKSWNVFRDYIATQKVPNLRDSVQGDLYQEILNKEDEPAKLPADLCKDCLEEFFLGTRPKGKVCDVTRDDVTEETCKSGTCQHDKGRHITASGVLLSSSLLSLSSSHSAFLS
jgi:hypothetical protein